eukprot:ANDGO_01998.mRNA.1 hypothetical protein H696_03159
MTLIHTFVEPHNAQETPSIRDGYSPSYETNYRLLTARLICLSCSLLSLSHLTTCTAQVFMHRFLLRNSIKSVSASTLSSAAIFLSCKCTDDPQYASDIVEIVQNVYSGLRDLFVLLETDRGIEFGDENQFLDDDEEEEDKNDEKEEKEGRNDDDEEEEEEEEKKGGKHGVGGRSNGRSAVAHGYRIAESQGSHAEEEVLSMQDRIRLKVECVECEKQMLFSFGFVTIVKLPHPWASICAQALASGKSHPLILEDDVSAATLSSSPSSSSWNAMRANLDIPGKSIFGRLPSFAWKAANDSLLTDCCIRFDEKLVAAACVVLAAKALGTSLPDSWNQAFGISDESLDDIATICTTIEDVCYKNTFAQLQHRP